MADYLLHLPVRDELQITVEPEISTVATTLSLRGRAGSGIDEFALYVPPRMPTVQEARLTRNLSSAAPLEASTGRLQTRCIDITPGAVPKND